MKKFLLASFMLLLFFPVFAQDNLIKHVVEKGETVTKIAQKYLITPSDIYTLNPDAQNGLKPDQILLLPKGKGVIIIEKTPAEITQNITHLVVAKESLYGLAKQYNTTITELYKLNPGLEQSGLKEGAKIIVGLQKETISSINSPVVNSEKIHEVVAKETKYGIAAKYNMTVEELEALNPEIKNGLPIGTKLKISSAQKLIDTKEVVTETVSNNNYVVQPKETIYSLTRKFNLSEEKLIQLNPELKDGLREGMALKIPSVNISLSNYTKSHSDLTQTLNNDVQKELAVLLPFNISKIKNDTTQNITARLSNDKFLNRILDFYSGALIAIDSAKTLGLNVDIKIFDSQETKNSSGVTSIIQQNNFKNTDLVIGPFYQVNVEKTAQLLKNDSVLVMSPLSRETGETGSNIIYTMPSVAEMRDAVMNFIKSKKGKLIGVIDPKKGSVRKYFSENYPSVTMATFNGEGNLNIESLKLSLDRSQKNFVIVETANTFILKTTINTIVNALTEFDIQMVILESNDRLESDEILIENLAKLKLLYPSLYRENNSPEAVIFEKKFKEANKIAPNAYAVRGFDVTFDALLRLSQQKGFKESLVSDVSEQVENKFNYTNIGNQGYKNNGFYILQYEEDLSVTIAQ